VLLRTRSRVCAGRIVDEGFRVSRAGGDVFSLSTRLKECYIITGRSVKAMDHGRRPTRGRNTISGGNSSTEDEEGGRGHPAAELFRIGGFSAGGEKIGEAERGIMPS